MISSSTPVLLRTTPLEPAVEVELERVPALLGDLTVRHREVWILPTGSALPAAMFNSASRPLATVALPPGPDASQGPVALRRELGRHFLRYDRMVAIPDPQDLTDAATRWLTKLPIGQRNALLRLWSVHHLHQLADGSLIARGEDPVTGRDQHDQQVDYAVDIALTTILRGTTGTRLTVADERLDERARRRVDTATSLLALNHHYRGVDQKNYRALHARGMLGPGLLDGVRTSLLLRLLGDPRRRDRLVAAAMGGDPLERLDADLRQSLANMVTLRPGAYNSQFMIGIQTNQQVARTIREQITTHIEQARSQTAP